MVGIAHSTIGNHHTGELLKRRNLMLWTIIVVLVILWLPGFFGRNISPSFPPTGRLHLQPQDGE